MNFLKSYSLGIIHSLTTYFFGTFIILGVNGPYIYILATLGGSRSLNETIPDLGVVTMTVLIVFTSVLSTLLLRKKLTDVEPRRFLFGGVSSFAVLLSINLGIQAMVVDEVLHLLALCIAYGSSVFVGVRLLLK
jgi:hypothetical protein